MREILFRGKKKSWGGWCEGFLVKTGDHFRISTQNDLVSFGVDPETVGQFTGLTDKNGSGFLMVISSLEWSMGRMSGQVR